MFPLPRPIQTKSARPKICYAKLNLVLFFSNNDWDLSARKRFALSINMIEYKLCIHTIIKKKLSVQMERFHCLYN